ncbi:checkpoint protein HUS1 [Ahaetulla prasina]|uniref:checkpoint protein HUS1 n=1 Tax=Ahaetulla prasina TaxID=499056 RepID=UPI00264A2BD0|nr:checkpoint protein HUS1 [Ahaetulla prasina]
MVDWRTASGSPDAEAVAVMRFRAKIVDVGCLNHFSRVISTIAKLAKTCILRLTLDKLYFILSDKVANGGVSMWCELNQMNFFDEFQMEGVSAENNEIYLELAPENLSRALKTAQNAKTVKIKLTNKQCPCLTVSMELPSLSTSSRIVTHDIPVGVIPRKLWNDFREPSVPNFDVSIYLPVLKTMKCVVERMKNLSSSVVIEANLNGEMELKIETDLVCITTHFRDLGNPPWVSLDESQNSTHERDPMNMAEARIDIKRLLQFLAGQQVNPTKALCNIVSKRIVHFILLHEDVSLQYFIPALA